MSSRLQPRKDGKYIIQVLLSPARGKSYVNYVEDELGQQPSAHLKELVFKFLEEQFPEDEYKEIKEKDDANWKDIVERRIEGKVLVKIDSLIEEIRILEESKKNTPEQNTNDE